MESLRPYSPFHPSLQLSPNLSRSARSKGDAKMRLFYISDTADNPVFLHPKIIDLTYNALYLFKELRVAEQEPELVITA